MIRLFPPDEILETTVSRLPLSKSVAARAMVLSALSGMRPDFSTLPDCRDIEVLREALWPENEAGTIQKVDVADSGTALRFLTAYFAAKEGAEVEIDGSARLRERPVGRLVDALRSLGAQIAYTGQEGHAPLRITGKKLEGAEVTLDASQSSQYVSALALIAPTLPEGLRIHYGGRLPSMPYLKMTLEMLGRRGIEAYTEGYTAVIEPGTLRQVTPESEPDWTAASYWYSIAAVSAGWVTLPGLQAGSLQGDSILATLGERFGVVTEFGDEGAELSAHPDIYSRLDLDMTDYPDLVPALAVTGCLLGLPFVFTGVANLRVKECDRLAVLSDNLARLGFGVTVGNDTIEWEGERHPVMSMPEIDPHGDHRMAMAFAAAAFYCPGIVIHHPETVAKSYPGFFEDLSDAGFAVCGKDDPIPSSYLLSE